MQPAKHNIQITQPPNWIAYDLNLNVKLTQSTWFDIRSRSSVSRVFGTNAFKMAIIIYTFGGRMTTMRTQIAFIDVMAFITMSFVARLTFAVVPTGHVNTIGR